MVREGVFKGQCKDCATTKCGNQACRYWWLCNNINNASETIPQERRGMSERLFERLQNNFAPQSRQ